MSTSHCTTACTSAAADVTRAGMLHDELFNDGALDYLPHDFTYDSPRELRALLARAEQALGGTHAQPAALLA